MGGHVGGKGPYTICFTANKDFGVIEVDLSYFHVNVPEAVGTKFAKTPDLSEEDLRDMQPVLTDEELKYFAEQQHIKQILHRQHRGIWHFAVKVKVLGYTEAGLIVLCSILQYVFVRRLFKSKHARKSTRSGLV